jgi:Zn-dependent peptidase ImmA (M78 family)
MSEELSREEVRSAIDRTVQELLQTAAVQAPPVDAIAIAQRHLGMVVCLDRGQPQRGRAAAQKRGLGRKQIFLRPEASEERHQWTVAHEIGEHLKPGLLQRLGIPPDQTRVMLGESLTNLFAHRLLVPSCWLADEARACDNDIVELKQRFRTASHEVVAWRLLDLSAPCIITILDNDAIHRRRSNAWRVRRELSEPERQCQRYVSQYSRPQVVREQGWTVQGWPVHSPDWKREILRSVVDVDELERQHWAAWEGGED